MAHPLFWPGKYVFYPIGNTPAVSFTRDIPPEEPANVLLLGCGDPRNILYTIFSEIRPGGRTLDFTCCDIEPAVLARNVLLLTLLADQHFSVDVIWNIYFHMYIDKTSQGALFEQCTKLVGMSDTLEQWANSPYASFLRMNTAYTLSEIRRHWILYTAWQTSPPSKIQAIRDTFKRAAEFHEGHGGIDLSSVRSAGPSFSNTQAEPIPVLAAQFINYWKTGTTFSDQETINTANLLNPTFVYSLGGERCCIDYGLDPILSFHLAPLFGNAHAPVSISDVVIAVKAEFHDWCLSFQAVLHSAAGSRPVIRFFLGEAIAVCHAISMFSTLRTKKSSTPVAQWSAQLIELNDREYTPGGAPTEFNVIDTSNLDDHIGPLNVLVCAIPLLPAHPLPRVLYTESLLPIGKDPTKDFVKSLHGDITVISLLLGVCPVSYLSHFSTRANYHELAMKDVQGRHDYQFQEMVTWKSPAFGDAFAVQDPAGWQSPAFDSYQLGTFLYDMFYDMFKQEDPPSLQLSKRGVTRAIIQSNLVHYVRETFVLWLKFVMNRLQTLDDQWSQAKWVQTMNRFLDIMEADTSAIIHAAYKQELFIQLHCHGLYMFQFIAMQPSRARRFLKWSAIPPFVRIILIVPRKKLSRLDTGTDDIGTPPLQCEIRNGRKVNVFCSIHAAYGRVVATGTGSEPRCTIKEDPKGRNGSSPLLVSFIMATRYITEFAPMEQQTVCLCIRATFASADVAAARLGKDLIIFEANMMDESAVLILPEQHAPTSEWRRESSILSPSGIPKVNTQLGAVSRVTVDLDEQCELASTFTARIDITNENVRLLFMNGAIPKIVQVSPCTMRLSIGSYMQDVIFPFPIIGADNKLGLARKSSYINVIVPVYGSVKPRGMNEVNSFPIVNAYGNFRVWNVHYVNLSRLPPVNLASSSLAWLNTHAGSMWSVRERGLRSRQEGDTMTHVKDTLHTLLLRSSGAQGGPARRAFALHDHNDPQKNCDIILFISELKFDLQCHAILCEGYVWTLTNDVLRQTMAAFSNLMKDQDLVHVSLASAGEIKAWKQMLPVAVERCRQSWRHGDRCEYMLQKKIPLSVEMEANVDPLCSCGRGRDTEPMKNVALWRPFAPHVTRVALSPLFAVTYLEKVIRNPQDHKCLVCRGRGKPTLKACSRCNKVRYCSQECQKKHWKAHKPDCKP